MELVDLESFKTKKCDKQHPVGLSNCHLECPFYHSRDDKRRSPLSATKTSLVYSHTYLEDFYSTQMASNLVEHLFHPDVYKTINCTSRFTKNFQAIGGKKTQECRVKWCPYLHKKEDISNLAKYRGLQMLVPLQEPPCLKLEQADHLNILLKGSKTSIQAQFGTEISTFKEHLRNLVRDKEEEKELSNPSALVKAIAGKEKEATKDNSQKIEKVVLQKGVPEKGMSEKGVPENWYTEYEYLHHGEKLAVTEDRFHEFKNYRDIVANNIAPIVMKYIAAFLNAEGGVLYVGVNDNSEVTGFEITQHEYDRFLLNIDGESKNILPPLMPHKFTIRKIPVLGHRRKLWVVEVKVTPSEQDKRNKVLTVYNREAYIRMNASTRRLDAISLVEYIRHHEEQRQEQRTGSQALEELTKSLERKEMGLQDWLDVRERLGRLGEKVNEAIGGLRSKQGAKSKSLEKGG